MPRPLHKKKIHTWKQWLASGLLSCAVVAGMLGYEATHTTQANGAYTIGNSARFATTTSDYLNRTPGGAGTQTKWTYSTWIKRGDLGTFEWIFGAAQDANNYTGIFFHSNDGLEFLDVAAGVTRGVKVTSAVFRDPAAWVHIVVAIDTTQSSAANRNRIYINGVEQRSFSTSIDITQNVSTWVTSANAHYIGRNPTAASQFFEGYLADTYVIDGAQLTPSCFGATDANGYWRPIQYVASAPCAAYGTNGFHLDFSNGASLGTDSSGNSNTWTVNGLTSIDQVIDTPSNSFATLNPLNKYSTETSTKGNLVLTADSSANWQTSVTPFGISSGKWYWEVTPLLKSGANNYFMPGIVNATFSGLTAQVYPGVSATSNGYGYHGADGKVYFNATLGAYGAAYTVNDVIGVALDMDAGTLTFYKNNVSQGTATSSLTGTWFPALGLYQSASALINFGQGGTTTLTYDSASGGYFRYTPPSGFKALSTSNMPAPAITVPNKYFDAITYTSPVVLLHMDGTNGSTSFVDSSTAARTVTVVGNAQMSTAQSKFGGASALFDGTGDRVTVPDSADMELGSSDFTIDFWMNRTPSMGGTGDVVAKRLGGNIGPFLFYSAANVLYLYMSSNGTWDVATGLQCGSPSDGAWHHVALTRKGTAISCFLDGTFAVGTTTSAALYDNTAPINIGGNNGGTEDYPGYVDEVRIIKGLALWTANFTPPTSAYSHGVTAANFQPDLVWIKDRTSANDHVIEDSVRTAAKVFTSISNAIEGLTGGGWIKSFNTNGFSIDTNAPINTAGNNYISWLWKKAPTVDGVDIVSYSGDNTSNRNISHSLGAAPDMVIVKRRDSTGDPYVWHSSLAGATSFLLLDSTAAVSTSNTPWGTGNFSSTQFMVTNNSTNNANYMAPSGTTTVTYSTAGTYSFTVPDFAYMTVTVNGAGGSGGGAAGAQSGSCGKGCVSYSPINSTAGSSGGNSSFNSSVVGNGGGGGGGTSGGSGGGAGSSGTASGGDTNTTGGGTSGASGASNNCSSWVSVGAGGTGAAGGQAVKAYTAGAISGSITVVVGAGVSGGAGGVGDTCTGTTGTASGAGSVVIAYSGGSTGTYVAYLFKGIAGFSKFGSYIGNGSVDGPFVYTDFKPRYILIKRTDTTGSWQVHDTARSSYNPLSNELYPNLTAAEDTTWLIDSNVNGFKLRSDGSSTDNNANGGTYIYAAFADVPFKYSAASAPLSAAVSAVSFLMGMSF